MKLFERSRRLNYILCGVIFAGVIIYTLVATGNRDMLYFKASSEAVIVQGPEGYTISIRYDDIENVELLDVFDRGISAGGVEGKDLNYGTFENDLYGKYELFEIVGVRPHIAITANDGKIVVITRENNGDTETYCDALKQTIGK